MRIPIQIRGSVPRWLTDRDPTPDLTLFFSDFKYAKKNICFHIFSFNLPAGLKISQAMDEVENFFLPISKSLGTYTSTTSTLSSVLSFSKICVRILFWKHYFSPLNTFMRKGKDSDLNQDLWLMDLDPGDPKTCGSGSPTLGKSFLSPILKVGWQAERVLVFFLAPTKPLQSYRYWIGNPEPV